jgi:hypothetical protein
VLEAQGVMELSLRLVETDGSGALAGEVHGPLSGTAPELEDIAPHHRAEDLELGFGDTPGTPRGGCAFEVPTVRGLVVVGVSIPERPVPVLRVEPVHRVPGSVSPAAAKGVAGRDREGETDTGRA